MNSKGLNQHEIVVSSEKENPELNEDTSTKDLTQDPNTLSDNGEITEIVEDMLIDVSGGGVTQVIKSVSRSIGRFNKTDFGSFLVPGAVGVGAGAGGYVTGQQIKKSRTSNNPAPNNPTTPQV